MDCQKLTSTRVWRTYRGGYGLDSFLGKESPAESNFPEDWIASVVRARNPGREDERFEGYTFTDSGDLLCDLIEKNPEKMLGKAHAAKFGSQMGVLAKLLDAGERLTIQVHPDNPTAQRLFQSPFGKTESWHFLSCRETADGPACIYLGFRPGISREYWKSLFERQDIQGMLDCLHKIPVQAGETYLIQGGVPHAIGAGCFLTEIQEPTDYTIRVEKTTPSGLTIADSQCHQGLGFEKMFDCFTYAGKTYEETVAAYRLQPQGDFRIRYEDTEKFCLWGHTIAGERSFSGTGRFFVLIVTQGEGTLTEDSGEIHLHQGDRVFVPACCPGFALSGNLKVLCYTGPKL